MKLPRRQFLHLAAGAAALPAVSRLAWAQTYPARPVRIIVGFPAGNASDIIVRLMAQSLSERLGQQFVVENRPGAGGSIGTEVVVKASADGYTLLMEVVTANAINATFYANLNYNFIRDITPVASIVRGPFVMVVNPSVPAKTLPEFIVYAKANPGKINMASAGSGTAIEERDSVSARMPPHQPVPITATSTCCTLVSPVSRYRIPAKTPSAKPILGAI